MKNIDDDDQDIPFAKDGGWVNRLPKIPVNRRYVSEARSAASIASIPVTEKAIETHRVKGTPITDDAKVPEPSELLASKPSFMLIAYSYHVHHPDKPPNDKFETWEKYSEYMRTLPYLSAEWKEEHDKFMVASSAGKALGIDPRMTPEKFWSKCRRLFVEEHSSFVEYILSRGLFLEPIVDKLYSIVCNRDFDIRDMHTMVNSDRKWIMSTSDRGVYDRVTGKLLYVLEFKCPNRAFVKIPGEYMIQIQLAMWTAGVDQCDIMALELDDYTLKSTFIVHRVKRSDEYIKKALPVLEAFCRSVLTGTRPPPKGTFVPPDVPSRMILRIEDAIGIIPDGISMVRDALSKAKAKAHYVTRPIIRPTQ